MGRALHPATPAPQVPREIRSGLDRRRARRGRARRGLALPLALLLFVALGFVVTAAFGLALTAGRIATNVDAFNRSLAVAEGGLDRGVEQLASAYEAGTPVPDTMTVVEDSLDGFAYRVRTEVRREPPRGDMDGNGVAGEVVRYERAFGYREARAEGGAASRGEPVRVVTSRAQGRLAAEELLLEVAFERDPAVADPRARGAWRVVALRWSAIVGHL